MFAPFPLRFPLLAIALTLLGIPMVSGQEAQESAASFLNDIRPLLSDRCFQCHGPDEETRATDLRLDLREAAFGDLGGYQAIVPGDPTASELIERITSEDPDLQMPPADSGKSLSDEERGRLIRWIEEGAEWSEFWAYVPPRRHSLPAPGGEAAAAHWIDRQLGYELERRGLALSAPTDPTTLIRRLYFDLVGLPPTPEEVQQFTRDPSPENYEAIVDHLLESPHFGERMAIYWLDLVRFADTVGYHGDQDHNISPYRDWVIRAFNQNLPFDQFTREQLAGDLLPQPTRDQMIATGYNRLLQTSHEGGIQPKEYIAIYAADRVRNVSSVWMGATVGCAQCHDHKYDPYTSRDFYALAAFFADIDDTEHLTRGTNTLPTARPPEILVLPPEEERAYQQVQKRIASLQRQRELIRAQRQQKEKSDPAARAEDAEIADDEAQLEAQLKQAEQELKAIETRGAWTMITRPLEQPRTVRVLPRGDWMDDSGPVVEPAIPEFLGHLDLDRRATRLDLAEWLTDPEGVGGPLTARVFANRFWYLLMGGGLSPSLDDFGGQGTPPVYPELLDHLALEFLESGWDVKSLIRDIVTSRAYQQSSLATPELQQRDPGNRWFARQSRYRLPAELVRDTALAVSGLLNVDQIGGKSIKPYQPAGYYRHLNFPPRKYSHTTDPRQYRRGVYVHWQRQFLHPTLRAMDAPTREECTARRPRSNTPLAALAALNDPSFVEAARVFAQRILQESGEEFDERLDRAWWLALSRAPTPAEQTMVRQLWEASLEDYREDPQGVSALLSVGMADVDPLLDPLELAAWTTVTRAILNLNETLTRN